MDGTHPREALLRVGAPPLFFLVPPTTALLAWLVLGETVQPLGWLGLTISAVGVAVVTLERRRVPAPA
jgi:drug/metabolite transporter (DMT)-like permease